MDERKFANHEIVTIAVFLCGGRSAPIDTEDVAIKANTIAPGRFTWRKYPDQINIENVRTFLSDAKKPKCGGTLTGSGRGGWMLTAAGLALVRKIGPRFNGTDLSRKTIAPAERQWRRSERQRLLKSIAFAKESSGQGQNISAQDLLGCFRLTPYVTGDARRRKVDRLLTAFRNDRDIAAILSRLANRVLLEGSNAN